MGNSFRLADDGSHYIGSFSKGGEFLIDHEDYPLVSQFTWQRGKRGYPITGIKRKTTALHRMLLMYPSGFDVDHISGDKMDNRRANLRVCTHQQNMCNQKKRNTNTSGFMGVSFSNNARAYEAYVHCHGKKHYLGLFSRPEEAASARDRAALRLFGDFARLNYPSERGCSYG